MKTKTKTFLGCNKVMCLCQVTCALLSCLW